MSNHITKRDWRRGGTRNFKAPRYRKERPKSFTSEESAKKWAEENKISGYSLKNLKSPDAKTPKIVVVY